MSPAEPEKREFGTGLRAQLASRRQENEVEEPVAAAPTP